MSRRVVIWCYFAVAVFCVAQAVHAPAQQPKAGQISGHVVDQEGATIKGANIFVRRNMPPEEDVRLLTHADIHGDFKLVLPEGSYDVLVTSPGFATAVETLPVFAGKTKEKRWRLKSLDCSFPGTNCDTFQ